MQPDINHAINDCFTKACNIANETETMILLNITTNYFTFVNDDN